MANILDADPRVAAQVAAWMEWTPNLAPYVRDGEIVACMGRKALDLNPLPDPLPVIDYVAGLEALGYRFAVGPVGERFYLLDMSFRLPPLWKKHAQSIMRAFGDDRFREVTDFIVERDGRSS